MNPQASRLDRIEAALEAQRRYVVRVPDPDNRSRAETNLLTLLEMRDAALTNDKVSQPAKIGA